MLFVLPDPLAPRGSRGTGLSAAGIAVLAHAGLIAALAAAAALDRAPIIETAHPIAVRLLEAEPPKAAPVPPPPVPVPVRAQTPPVKTPRPAPVQPVAVPVVTAPMAAAAPVAEAAAPSAPASAPADAAPTVSEARFDADYLNNPRPIYPPASRRMGETGTVLLRVQVGEDGMPLRIDLKASSGSSRLDQSALDTVARWKFVPARRGATPVSSWVVVPVQFTLN